MEPLARAAAPALFHGWVAAGALALGDRTIEPLFLWSLWGPLAALLLFTALSGRRAGGATGAAIAVLTLVAAPAVLELASRTLVDVTLAATVAATLFLLARRLDGGGVGASALVGAAAGAAALTKLTAPLFLAPMVLVATFHIGRFESRAAALRFLGVATLVAAAVAAPWYLRHGVEAVEFARYAASFWPCADTGSAWSRPLRLIGATASWPLAVGLAGLAWFAHSKRRAVPQGGVPWGALALAGSLPAAVVVMLPPVFEPRYLFSALPPLAASPVAGRLPSSGGFLPSAARFSSLRAADWQRLRSCPRRARVVRFPGAPGACSRGSRPTRRRRCESARSGTDPTGTSSRSAWWRNASGCDRECRSKTALSWGARRELSPNAMRCSCSTRPACPPRSRSSG